ncbi:MAG TPA: MFS transporter [Capillimicrobium sp.]|jgi:EmrB/QacA subfamily drug resistance transporter
MSPADARRAATSPWIVLVLVCLAQFMVVLDVTIVNVAMPSIQADLGMSESDLQWIINAYTLVFGGFLLLGGRAADLFGRQKLFLAGVALFATASAINGLATSSEMLIAGRALQGLGGALVSPAALSIVIHTFPEGSERTKALGVWSAIAAGGGAVGLLLGGVLTDLLTWEWTFFVNVPVGLAAFILSLRLVPDSRAEHLPRSVDFAGAFSVTAGLVVLVYAIVEAESAGWGSGQTLGLLALAAVLLSAFVAIERRSPAPLVRLGIFKVRSLLGANLVLLFVAAGMFASFFFVSLYVQRTLGLSPLEAGLAFMPFTVGIMAGATLAQQGIRRFGPRPVTMVGMTLAAIGLFLQSSISVDGSYVANVLPGTIITSFGMGLTFVPITLIATTNVSGEDAGLASGLFNTSQQVGGALGLAILSTFATDKTASALAGGAEQMTALVDGWQLAMAIAAGLMLVAVAVLGLLVRRQDVDHIRGDEPVPVAA